MKTTQEMPAVRACSVSACAYNSEDSCHAKAITIGDGVHPHCDTFLDDSAGHTHMHVTAGVGACKVIGCSFNSDFECTAADIRVDANERSADCTTYRLQ